MQTIPGTEDSAGPARTVRAVIAEKRQASIDTACLQICSRGVCLHSPDLRETGHCDIRYCSSGVSVFISSIQFSSIQ
jgi:hypothetical protein